MYCGDETGAFVGDLGHTTSRFGYGGEDCPKSVVPSWTLAGDGSGGNKRQHKHASCPGSTLRVPPSLLANEDGDASDIVPIFDWSKSGGSCHPDDYLGSSGVVANWDAYEAAWSDAFSTLRVWDGRKHTTGSGGGGDTEEERKCIHPLLAVDAGHTCYGRHEVKNRDKDADAGSSASASAAAIEAAGPADPDERLRLQQRSKMMELLFEKFDAPAVFIAPSPMLAAFAHGRQTGLVVDVGGSGTRVTPIIDGLVLRSAQRRSGRGGEWLGAVQERALTEFCGVKDVVPHYALGPPPSAGASGGSSSRRRTVKYGSGHALRKTTFHQVAMADYMYEMLTGSHVNLQPWRQDLTVPFVGYEGDSKKRKRGGGGGGDGDGGDGSGSDDGDGPSDDDEAMETDNVEAGEEEVEGTSYTLPDGTRVDLAMSKPGKDLCRLPELLYTDEVPFETLDQQNALSTFKSGQSVAQSTLSSLPVHRLAHASLTAVGDGDARKELCGNILLTGGASLFPNMEARLSYEMSNTAPSAYKCKVVASRNTVERRYAPWIGGSILTSLGSFQQLWLSRAEYEEYGATLGSDRFP